MGNRHRSYGGFRGRVRLRRSAPGDMSLVIKELQLNDTGRYRCEVIDGLEDESVTVELELQGDVCVCLCVFVSHHCEQQCSNSKGVVLVLQSVTVLHPDASCLQTIQ